MPYDFPDFLPSKQPSNTNVRVFDQTVTSTQTVAAIDTTPYDSIIVFGNNEDAGAIMELQIGFLGGILDPTPDPVKSIVFNPGQSGSIRVPPIRAQLQILVVPHGPVATQHFQVSEYGLGFEAKMNDLYQGPIKLFSASPALAANANTTLFVSQWYAGPVEIGALGDNGGPAVVVFDYYDAGAGSYVEFMQLGMLSQNSNTVVPMTFPPAPVRIRIFNGATAQTVEVYVAASVRNGI